MMSKLSLLAAVAAIGLFIVAPPAAFAAPNDCIATGATGANGEPVASPCVDTRPGDPRLQAVQDQACAAATLCPRYYIFLVPDQDGHIDPTDNDLDFRLVWEETNNCGGLQRFRTSGCIGADNAILL